MLRICMAVSVVLVVGFFSPAVAEYYQYRAPDGSIRFTDDLTKIPEPERSSMTRHDEVRPSFQEIAVDTSAAGMEQESSSSSSAADRLAERRKALDEEYEALQEERTALDKAFKEIKTEEDRAAYIQKMSEYNEKAKAYQGKIDELNKDIAAYNRSLRGVEKSDDEAADADTDSFSGEEPAGDEEPAPAGEPQETGEEEASDTE